MKKTKMAKVIISLGLMLMFGLGCKFEVTEPKNPYTINIEVENYAIHDELSKVIFNMIAIPTDTIYWRLWYWYGSQQILFDRGMEVPHDQVPPSGWKVPISIEYHPIYPFELDLQAWTPRSDTTWAVFMNDPVKPELPR